MDYESIRLRRRIERHMAGCPKSERRLVRLFLDSVGDVYKHYPEDVFPTNGESLDCKSAFVARFTCKNVLRELSLKLTGPCP